MATKAAWNHGPTRIGVQLNCSTATSSNALVTLVAMPWLLVEFAALVRSTEQLN